MRTTSIAWDRHRVLVLAPHADDETFGCGGLIAKIKAEGGEVYVIVASIGDLQHYGVSADGAGARHRSRAMVREGQPTAVLDAVEATTTGNGEFGRVLITGDERAKELDRAMTLLRVDGYEVLFTDTDTHLRLDAIPRRDLIAHIERDARYAIDKIEPTVLVLPEVSYNQDHEAVFKAGFSACRPQLPSHKPFVQIVLSCDAPQLGWNTQAFHPNFYVDISAHLGLKLQAHACHRSQLKPPPHHASLENLERLARLRGAEVAVEAAEAFRCYRLIA